jgi:membrane peptidoglycan carboxypeptidase
VSPARPQALVRLLVFCAVAGLVLAGVLLPLVGGAGLFARGATVSFNNLPADLKAPPPPQRSRLLAADGSTIAQFFTQDRVNVPLAKVAPVMAKAIIAIEDVRFFSHGAVDLQGTLRAALTNLGKGRTAQGGSTLTQQYVKNVLVASGDKTATKDTLARKVREARYAIALEQRLSKNQILERYLNIVYFGEGAYGVESAAHRYFGVPASRLTLTQSAMLAGLVQSPTDYDPLRHPNAARQRRDEVLDRMVTAGFITDARRRAASATPVAAHLHAPTFGCESSYAPFFCDWVHHLVLADPRFGADVAEREQTLMTGGLTVRTTLSPKVQRAAQKAVDHVVPAGGRVATAVVVVQPGTGAVLGMAVDRRYGSHHGQTRVNLAAGGQSGFQAGSTFKLFTLAAAVDKGMALSTTFHAPPHITIPAGDMHDCAGGGLSEWKVSNAEAGEGGTFGLVRATWESVNTYFAQLERKVGVCAAWRLADKMGITELSSGKPPAQVPSFTLGADDTSPLQVAGAYAAVAARGVFCAPYGVVSVTDAHGKPLEAHKTACDRVMSQSTADTVTSVLRGVIDGPDRSRTGASASIGRPAAGKTGTTESFGAAWFSGFTPQLAASVWVGDPRGIAHPLVDVTVNGRFYSHVYGADLPAAVWSSTMRGALRGVPANNFAGAGAHVAADVMSAARGGGTHKLPATLPPAPPPAAHQRPPKHGHGHH